MNESKKKKIIIGSLCAIVLLMAVGYASFNSVLNIGGTTSISSNWSVHFDKSLESAEAVDSKIIDGKEVIKGTVTLAGAAKPTGTLTYNDDLSANIEANLYQPGDKVIYNLTVVNDGTLDAVLENVNMPVSNNNAITITLIMKKDGIDITEKASMENTALKAKESQNFQVIVEYMNEIMGQPESNEALATISLDYAQSTTDSHKHIWDDGVETEHKTCEKNGEITYTCIECGKTKIEIIPAEHQYIFDAKIKSATCTNTGIARFKCQVCGEKTYMPLDKLEHTPPGSEYFEDATCEEPIKVVDTCKVCGEKFVIEYLSYLEPKLGHNYVNGVCTRCGKTES